MLDYRVDMRDDGFTLALRPDFPMRQARSLAVTAASWVRAAVGGSAKIHWPNHVVLDEKRVCAIACRATAEGDIMFTFRPDVGALSMDPDAFRRAVVDAAAEDLAGYPENQPALIQKYCEHCVTVMKFVETVYRGVPVYGFAFAVDKHGGLMIMTQESRTVVTVYGGEVRLAKKEDAPEPPELPRMPGN